MDIVFANWSESVWLFMRSPEIINCHNYILKILTGDSANCIMLEKHFVWIRFQSGNWWWSNPGDLWLTLEYFLTIQKTVWLASRNLFYYSRISTKMATFFNKMKIPCKQMWNSFFYNFVIKYIANWKSWNNSSSKFTISFIFIEMNVLSVKHNKRRFFRQSNI